MFRMKVSDAKLLRDTISAIAALIEEGTFKIDSEGLSLRAMDPSRVAMVDFSMNKSFFDEYVSNIKTKVCLNIGELLKLLRRSGKDESAEIFLDKDTGQLVVTIRGKYTRTFRMPTLEETEEEVPIPKIAFNAKVVLTATGLRQSLEDVALVGDHVRIETEGVDMSMSAKGDIMGAHIELKKGSNALLSVETKEPSRSTYPLSYLSDIVKSASSTSEIVTLEFSTDMPLRLDFKQIFDGTLIYYLAPRIEVE